MHRNGKCPVCGAWRTEFNKSIVDSRQDETPNDDRPSTSSAYTIVFNGSPWFTANSANSRRVETPSLSKMLLR